MFTDEQLKQLRSVIREEGEPLNATIDAVDQRLRATIDAMEVETKKTREAVIALSQKFDASQVDMGGLLHEILTTVSDHETKLERRVATIEDHLGFAKPH